MPLDDALKERALANFELLLEFWKVDYKKITENEYDLLATWRKDKNFGSCRFNTEKGRGADFAGSSISKRDIALFGTGFDENDFSGFSEEGQAKIGFDIIGLCQRIYRCNTYQDARRYLNDDLRALARDREIIIPSEERIKAKQLEREKKEKRKQEYARDLWESSKYHSLKGSLGEKYLNSRGITKLDKNIRFHPHIQYAPLKENFPALLFPIQREPEGEIQGIHRIYLSQDGTKAKVENPKMALASVKGGAIWFGEPCSQLWVAEGPENTLTCLEMGGAFAACVVFSSNFHNLFVPRDVTKLYIIPDPDPAGMKAVQKLIDAKRLETKLGSLSIGRLELPIIKKPNKKYADLNDIYMGNF